MSKITSYEVLSAPASDDVLPVVDVNDTTMASTGTTKNITVGTLDKRYLGLAPSGDTTGATDPVNIQALLNLAGKTSLQSGTFYLGGSSALSLATAGGVLGGSGLGTKLQITSGFSAAEVVSIAAPNCAIRDLSIIGASSTIASNPACNGVEIQPGSYQYAVTNVFTQYVNGYSFEGTNNGSSPDISHSIVDKLWSYNCAGGIHFNGDQQTAGVTMSNISIGNGGTASGANANLDAIFIEEAFDLVFTNLLVGVGDAGTGQCFHIKGNCSAIIVNGFDAGGYPDSPALASTQCGLLIENDGSGNSAERISFSHGIFQTFGQGAEITGGAQQISFTNVRFANNVTHGCTLAGTGTQINFTGCTFSGSGSGASGTNYDLNNSGTAQGTVRDCHFLTETGVTAGAAAGVQYTVNMGTGGTALNFEHCDFRGTLAAGSYLTYTFTNLPHIVRNCANLNPWGSASVAVPSSGTASGALHYDAMFYITANASGSVSIVRNTNGQGGGTGPTITIPAGATLALFVPAATNFTPTYTDAPTWIVDGL